MRTRLLLPLAAAVVFAVLIVVGAGRFQPDDSAPQGVAAPAVGEGRSSLLTGHVHGIARHPVDGQVYVATHDGLFVLTGSGPPTPVGPTIDLMGFTITEQGLLFASGHPGVGTDLPQPVGLIESADGGKSWAVRSRGGRSDFHSLTSSSKGVWGYDGTVRYSSDTSRWRPVQTPSEVMSLGASPDGATVLAATTGGLLESRSYGDTWTALPSAPSLVLLDWADTRHVVGIDRAGALSTSEDAGRTWRRAAARPLGPPEAISASVVGGRIEILVVTHAAILRSVDDGTTFSPLR